MPQFTVAEVIVPSASVILACTFTVVDEVMSSAGICTILLITGGIFPPATKSLSVISSMFNLLVSVPVSVSLFMRIRAAPSILMVSSNNCTSSDAGDVNTSPTCIQFTPPSALYSTFQSTCASVPYLL